MDVNVFKRNVTLHKLGIGELEGNEKKIYDYMSDVLFGLSKYIQDEFVIEYGKNKLSIILRYNFKTGVLYVSYNSIWCFFRDELGMRIDDMDNILIWLVGDKLDIKPIWIGCLN